MRPGRSSTERGERDAYVLARFFTAIVHRLSAQWYGLRKNAQSVRVPAPGGRRAAAAPTIDETKSVHTHMAENPYAHTDRGMRENTAL